MAIRYQLRHACWAFLPQAWTRLLRFSKPPVHGPQPRAKEDQKMLVRGPINSSVLFVGAPDRIRLDPMTCKVPDSLLPIWFFREWRFFLKYPRRSSWPSRIWGNPPLPPPGNLGNAFRKLLPTNLLVCPLVFGWVSLFRGSFLSLYSSPPNLFCAVRMLILVAACSASGDQREHLSPAGLLRSGPCWTPALGPVQKRNVSCGVCVWSLCVCVSCCAFCILRLLVTGRSAI